MDLKADLEAIARIEAVPLILDVVCRATGMGFAAIARVTEDRWVACATRDLIQFGLAAGGELDVETTICHEIRASHAPVTIDDVENDPKYCGHHTPARYAFRSYISMPIFRRDGFFFGTLCAIDPKPARVSEPGVVSLFRLFADLIGLHLDTHDQLDAKDQTIAEQSIAHDVRDQFVAVLGHDLRTPLSSIDAGMNLLERGGLDERQLTTVRLVRSSVKRMAELIDNVLDFARGRLGGGITVDRSSDVPLAPVLEQVVAEARSSFPERTIQSTFDLERPVNCDPSRISQMLSNLLANALSHGLAHGPVSVVAQSSNTDFELTVVNPGGPIPEELRRHLFLPFSGEVAGRRREGLGLGLYICSEIARAHGGTIELASDATSTRFTFTMPQ